MYTRTHQGFIQDFLLGGEQRVEVPAHPLPPEKSYFRDF